MSTHALAHSRSRQQLTQNPQVTSSRHWKYYIETNEWTRATCALMACLFSRDQIAISTVLGRGVSQRERLATTLVAYVVSKLLPLACMSTYFDVGIF